MIIRNYKKKVTMTSFILIITGILISFIGFGIGDFDLNMFKTDGQHKWYRTIMSDMESQSFKLIY